MNTTALDGSSIYTREPESFQDEIPVFSNRDAYVENYEKIAADHVAQISETQENPFMEEELWVSLEASTREYIQRYVAKGSRILDVGVGLGRLLEPLTEYERYGVDISLDYLTIAKQRGIEVALAKIEELPYAPGFFDAIVVCDVLEHVFDLNFCCEKILSCLRPGGVLIVRVPFKEDLTAYLDEKLPYEFIHLRNFDEGSLRLLFQKIFGLQFLEAMQTTHYLQGTPRLKLRLLPEGVRSKLATLAESRPELEPIASALHVSEETFQAWIYDLKKDSNALFRQISSDVIYGIDINAAFLKPYSKNTSLGDLRNTSDQILHSAPENTDRLISGLGRDFLKFRKEAKSNDTWIKSKILLMEESEKHATEGIVDSVSLLQKKISSLQHAVHEQQNVVHELQNAWLNRLAKKIARLFRATP